MGDVLAARLKVLLGIGALALAGCSGDEGPRLDLSRVKVCDVLTQSELESFGVDHVSQDGASGDTTRCTWQSRPPKYSLSVSFATKRLNDWIGKQEAVDPVAGFRASEQSYMMYVAAGPEAGVVGIEALRTLKPTREIAEAVVRRLAQEK